MAPGSPEASLEGNPAETSNSATTHTTGDDSANSSTAITSTTSSGTTSSSTGSGPSCKEMQGMLQEDLLVLREHLTLYWLLQKWKSMLMRVHRGGKRKEGNKMQN